MVILGSCSKEQLDIFSRRQGMWFLFSLRTKTSIIEIAKIGFSITLQISLQK